MLKSVISVMQLFSFYIITMSNSRKVDPDSITHIRIMKRFLTPWGAWPEAAFGEKASLLIRLIRIITPLHSLLISFGQIHYIVTELPSLDFFEIGDLLIAFFLGTTTVIRTAIPSLNGYIKISKMFFMEFHLMNFVHVGEHFEKMHHKVNKFSDYFARSMMSMMLSSLILYNMCPWFKNYRSGAYSNYGSENVTYQFAIYYSFPGFHPNNNFVIATCINLYISWVCGASVCSLDMYLSLMATQIIAHIKVLNTSIKNISDKIKTCDKYTQEENRIIHLRIKDCANHSCKIIKFVDAMSAFYGPLLGVNYLFHLVGCCLLLLECSSLTTAALLRYGPLTFVIFGQLILLSVTFEIVCSESVKLSDTVYATPWERMDLRNQTSMCIILRRLQEPIKVTALGMTEVSVRTMASILKTTFSYFAFLNSMQN